MTPEERREILAMVASGKISAADASTLLQGESSAQREETPPAEQVIPVEEENVEPVKKVADRPAAESPAPNARRRWLHVHVSDLKSGSRRVTVNLPLGLVRAGLALGGSVAPELRRFDWNDITALLDEQGGMIVEVKDEEDGEHVQIFVD